MSVTVDANVLVYASNAGDESHEAARELIERLAAGPDLVYLFWPTVMGYLRIVTHAGILPAPLAPREAAANVAGLLSRPHIRTAAETAGFFDLYRSTAGDGARGNQVPDAPLATLMRQHGVEVIYSRDRDFRRYNGITTRDPFAR
ncbi:MAG: TA system VapC family ribonuclease toxin [Thermoleophilaceae bacterium]